MCSLFHDQRSPLLRTFWRGAVPVLGLLLIVAGLAPRDDFRVAEVTRDVQSIADLPFYTGGLSTLGLLLWSASAAMCFLTPARAAPAPVTHLGWLYGAPRG